MSEPQRRVGQMIIQLNGNELGPELISALDEALVEDDLGQPSMFSLRFNDPQHALLDDGALHLGAEVKLSAAATAGGAAKPIMVGEIAAIEPAFEQQNMVLVIRGYDRSHRLYRGTKTRTFRNQSDSEIVGQVARAQGLRADAAAGGQIDYVVQHNQTDMAFLRARAARNGTRIVVEDKLLKVRRAEEAPPAAPAQEWGSTLLSFRARLTAVAQPNAVEVRGWDPKAKRALVGKASRPAQPSSLGTELQGGKAAETAFGDPASLIVTDQPVGSQREADMLAQAVLDTQGGDFLSAEGRCFGEPDLRAGTTVEISGLGKRLSGTYFVTATRHTYNAHEGYQTIFFVNGRRPGGLLAALDSGPPRAAAAGVVIGVVTNNNDPDKLGRVKVKFPWLDEQHESDWARIAAPGAGKSRGLYVLPEIDDEVLLAFEHGDLGRPFVIGGLWNGKDGPPLADAVKGGKVERRTITTRAGHQITVTDQDGQGAIALTTAGGQQLTLSDKSPATIEITTANGQKILLDDSPPGKIAITANGDIELAGAMGGLKIGAAGVELAAKGMMTVKADGILTIQGSLVKIN